MAQPPYGYRSGERLLRPVKIDSTTSDISAGDFLAEATQGYLKQASAGDMPVAVAAEAVSSPSADGDVEILADFSTLSVYEYPPDTGTVTQGIAYTTMDVGGAQSVNIDASTDDCLVCYGVDTVNNTLLVGLNPACVRLSGVV